MNKTGLMDRLSLAYLLENNRKEEFYNTIAGEIAIYGLNNYYLNMLKTASKKWHEEVSNEKD